MYRARNQKGEEGMMTIENFNVMKKFEMELRGLPGWKMLCSMVSDALKLACEPGFSFVNLVWPVDSNEARYTKANVIYNLTGRGREPVPLDASLFLVAKQQLEEVFFPSKYHGS